MPIWCLPKHSFHILTQNSLRVHFKATLTNIKIGNKIHSFVYLTDSGFYIERWPKSSVITTDPCSSGSLLADKLSQHSVRSRTEGLTGAGNPKQQKIPKSSVFSLDIHLGGLEILRFLMLFQQTSVPSFIFFVKILWITHLPNE